MGFLLVLTSCIAGILAGYRFGGELRDKEIADAKITWVAYDMKEFVFPHFAKNPDSRLKELREEVKDRVQLTSVDWDDVPIEIFKSNCSLVILADGRTHREIKCFVRDFLPLIKDLTREVTAHSR